MYNIQVDRRDAGRILSALRERHKKMRKNIEKFGDDFDPEKGAGMVEGYRDMQRLIHHIQEEMQK